MDLLLFPHSTYSLYIINTELMNFNPVTISDKNVANTLYPQA